MRAGSGDVVGAAGGAPPLSACGCASSSLVELELAAADLADIRFVPDPVWETVASLGVLTAPAA